MESSEKKYFEDLINTYSIDSSNKENNQPSIEDINFEHLYWKNIDFNLIKESFIRKYDEFIKDNSFLINSVVMQKLFGSLVIERLQSDIYKQINLTKHLYDCMKKTSDIDIINEYLTEKVKRLNDILSFEQFDEKSKKNVPFIDIIMSNNFIKTKTIYSDDNLILPSAPVSFTNVKLPENYNIESFRSVFEKNDIYRKENKGNDNWRSICFSVANLVLELKSFKEKERFCKSFNRWRAANDINSLEEFEELLSTIDD